MGTPLRRHASNELNFRTPKPDTKNMLGQRLGLAFFGMAATLILEACSSRAAPREPAQIVGYGARRQKVLRESEKHIGKRYVWDTNGPQTFDCSGFVHYVLKTSLGASAFPLPYFLKDIGNGYTSTSLYYRDELAAARARIKCDKAQAADIVFFPKPPSGGVNHIGLITDPRRQRFLTAQSKDTGVREEGYGPGSYWGSRAPECYKNIWIGD